MKKRVLASLLSLVLILSLLLVAALAAEPTIYEVDTADKFIQAVEEINGAQSGNYVISLQDNIDLSNQVVHFTSNTTTILGNGHTLTTFNFSSMESATLNLGKEDGSDTLTMKGSSTEPIVYALGTGKLHIYPGVTLCDNAPVWGSVGGIQINENAECHMYGGTITNCNGYQCGGVLLDDTARFYMYGGTISNCDGYFGGIVVNANASFEMTGGTITGCNSTSIYGGGITVSSDASFKMTDGKITGCTGTYGGGILTLSGNNTITGGEISGNHAEEGGGLYLQGSATINGVKIYNNTAANGGDDIVFDFSSGGTMNLEDVPSGLILDSTNKAIDGWYKDYDPRWSADSAEKVTSFSDTCYLKAAHGLPKYTVTFVPDNGETIPAQQIVQGGTAEEPSPAPEKSGFVFAGWYTDQAGTSSYDFNTPVTADITLYAKWNVDTSKTYTVTYYVDGNEYKKEEVQGGGTAVAPTPAPEKSGFVFAGWYTDPAVTTPYDFDTPVTGNLSLYARFIEFEVKVEVQINVDIIGPDRAAVSIGDDQKDVLAQNIDFKNDVKENTTKIEIDAIVKNAENKDEQAEITEYLTDQYNYGNNRIDYDVIVQKIIYPTPGTPVPLHELKEPIQITFAIPDKWQSGGTVSMFCAHTDGGTTVKELKDLDENPATFTIKSKKFSTYAMIYVPTSGGEGDVPILTYYTLHYESNGGTVYNDERYEKDTVVRLDKVPVREGYRFTGWYADAGLTQKIANITMTSDKTVYAGWYKADVPEMLNGEEHFAYVIGSPDGTVRPNANISRAEVATIFFRLLKPEIRDGNLTSASTFADVSEGMWYSKSIATMAKLGIIKGRSSETFDPNAPITRGEFAAICARFDTGITQGDSEFTDISGHWAEAEIERAVSLGWIMGYTDGTFRPDSYITRAEAMTMINRVLCRIPEDEDDLLPGMKVWPDNQPGTWYYLAVQEATNSHDFHHKGEIYEHWTGLTADPDWTRYQD